VYQYAVKAVPTLPRALIGPGAAELAGVEAAGMGLKHVLFVTTGLRGTGIIDELQSIFEKAGVAVSIYAKVESNPKDYNCMDAYKLYMADKCDGFVSIGGGSAHDATKGARVVATHDGRNINEFEGWNKAEKSNRPPHIAINTTVGTGSETSAAYVITDTTSPKAPFKWVGVDFPSIATLAINDPALFTTLPPEYIAFTGCDTVAHASECYTSNIDHPLAKPLALQALKLAAENLREAYANPHNYEAMMHMVWAEYMAAYAFMSGFLGIIHSLSHALCAYYDIHHGLNNGIGLARVWEYNVPSSPQKFADMAQALGEDTTGLSRISAADRAIDAVIRLVKDVGIPNNFASVQPYPKMRQGTGWYANRPKEIRSDAAEIDKLAQHMLNDICTPFNPRLVTMESARQILQDCIYGTMARQAHVTL
jgi:methanol:N,N-dimethyl-4-nitrosoaniline oxidoreductase